MVLSSCPIKHLYGEEEEVEDEEEDEGEFDFDDRFQLKR